MSRIGLLAAVSVAGLALAGCSSMLASNATGDQPLQALNFESDPPGAEVRTVQGQTCVTPCALSVPSQEQPVTVSHDGYVPQTVQVTVGPQPDHSFWQNPPPTLVPNPVRVVMQATAPPPRQARKIRRRRRTAAAAAARHAAAPGAGPDQQPPPPSGSSSAGSPFPPPPQGAADAAAPAPQQPAGDPQAQQPAGDSQAQQPGGDSAFPPPPTSSQ